MAKQSIQAITDSAKTTTCDLCDGSLLVSRGTQAGSACACDPFWAAHRAEREADIRRGLSGFSYGGEDGTYPVDAW